MCDAFPKLFEPKSKKLARLTAELAALEAERTSNLVGHEVSSFDGNIDRAPPSPPDPRHPHTHHHRTSRRRLVLIRVSVRRNRIPNVRIDIHGDIRGVHRSFGRG